MRLSRFYPVSRMWAYSMQNSVLKRLAILAVLISVTSGGPKNVLAFTISPMKVTLASEGGVQSIRIKNPSDKPVDMQMEVFDWSDSADLTALGATDDVMAMPPIFTVEPGGEQTVRLALRHPIDTKTERGYRVVIGEVPSEVSQETGLGFNLTVSLPLFVRPDGVQANPIWAIKEIEDNQLHLTLANEGGSYLKVGQVKLLENDVADEAIFETPGGYVLAGDSRSWLLDPNVAALKGAIVVKADSNIGAIETVIKLPDG